MRSSSVSRTTSETSVEVTLDLDAGESPAVKTGCGFLDHMLVSMAVHGGFSLQVRASGDIQVDYHHLVEDVGISLGDAFLDCLGTKEGMSRFGSALIPMDESLCMVAIDLSGRPCLVLDGLPPLRRVGDFDVDLVPEFLKAFADHAAMTLHARFLPFGNAHHALEAMFKGMGVALRQASALDPRIRGVRSTKGRL